MKIEEYLTKLGRLSAVKTKIIRRLWDQGSSFPRGWVKSSELLKLTNQKYFDRRVRELRDELGCDIENSTCDGEHAYRLSSFSINISNPRSYLTASQKKVLLENSDHTCSICGTKGQGGVRGLQADHKIPLKRGGSHEIQNWQVLCVECNVGKRSACAGCNLDCQKCPWAFPESTGLILTTAIDRDAHRFLNDLAKKESKTVGDILNKIIWNYKESNFKAN